MVYIWFIPLGVIFLLIFCSIGLAAEAIKSFMDALPYIIAAIVVTAILLGIHYIITVFKSKRPKCGILYSISEWVMILSSTFGLFAFAGPTWLDRCGRWFTWFGNGIDAQILTYISIVIILSTIIMVAAFFIPSNIVTNIILLLPIALPFCIYFNSLSVSTQSYSDFITTDFTCEDTLSEYEVVRDTKIYYPDIWKGDAPIPALSPIKYTSKEFKAGEIVYAIYASGSIENFEEGSYIIVSNGTIGGQILVDDLKDVAKPQYTYKIRTVSEESPVYKADVRTITHNYPVEGSYQIWDRTEEVIDKIEKNTEVIVTNSDDGFLRIKLSDGAEGYISCNDVEVVRIPLTD